MYFQQPGAAEDEIQADLRGWLGGFYAALSGSSQHDDIFTVPIGGRMSDRFPTGDLPSWLDETELGVRAGELVRTGAAGALNRYRNMDRDWEDLAAWEGAALHQPSVFLAGSHDASLTWMAGAIAAYPTTVPGLRALHLIEGGGHWVHQKRPNEVNELLVAFLRESYDAPGAATRS